MKIKYKKLIIFTVILTIVLSMLSLSAFAFNDPYVFKEELDKDLLQSFAGSYSDMSFVSNGITYQGFVISYRGYWVLEYLCFLGDGTSSTNVAYSSDEGWSSEAYRTLNFTVYSSDSNVISFLTECEYIESDLPDSWYYELYNIISSTLFGDYDVPQEASFAISLVSLLLSLICILLPVLLCFGIFIWVIKRV